ncbi:MAG TPA: magnesium-protoporphyrin IX monomethyl ester (oxidative) cyclase [Burkholderiaceae bacterium]|nr:magnesium-protoporphyrin IX monomethyl ester (oxidative) cyclase [Burkholderiaceae bacterium]
MDASESITTAEDASRRARAKTLLSPRFYRTDYAAMDRIDFAPLRREWDDILAEFERDSNRSHFERDEDFSAEVRDMPPALKQEFLDFLVSSLTAEFSGCVLYNEIRQKATNPDVRALMGYMARDESRHAGFINRSLRDFGLGVDLGALKKTKHYTYFRPKFIFYATYLSEKIGYARYITIFRHLERHPEQRFHPIFRWFESWCNDEFRHGEAFALIMRSDPKLLGGINRLWIRFFLLAVFATMYVRDHLRPALHEAFGFDPTDYDLRVLHITSEISRQVFPLTLDIENPAFRAGLDRLFRIADRIREEKANGGLLGRIRCAGLALAAVATFTRLYLLPVRPNETPDQVRLAPAW